MTRCPRCHGTIDEQHTDLECAVELVTNWLEEHGHPGLAKAVAAVTDPTPPEETAASVARLRELFPELAR